MYYSDDIPALSAGKILSIATPLPSGHRRGYQTQLKPRDLDNLSMLYENSLNMGENGPLGQISQVSIANRLPRVLRAGNKPIHTDIANGWDVKRLQFVFEAIEEPISVNGLVKETVIYVQGYTDYFEVVDGMLPDDLVFYFNQVFVVNYTYRNKELVNTKLLNAFNLIYTHDGRHRLVEDVDLYDEISNNLSLVRAEDIALYIGAQATGSSRTRIHVNSSRVGNIPRVSDSGNNIPAEFTANFFNNMVHSVNITQDDIETDPVTSLTLLDASEEVMLGDISLFRHLEEIYSTADISSADYRDLCEVIHGFREAMENTEISASDTYTDILDDIDAELATTDELSVEVTLAQELGISALSRAITNRLTFLHVSISNDTDDGDYVWTELEPAQTVIDGEDPVIRLSEFMSYLIKVILPSMFRDYTLNLEIMIDFSGSSFIMIDIYGGDRVVVPLATSASSLLSPIATTHDNYERVVNDFTSVTHVLRGYRNE